MPESVLTFRLACADDVPGIVSLVQSAYRGESSRRGWTSEADLLDGDRITPEQVLANVASGDGGILLAYANGTLVGCCQVQRRPQDLSFFGTFAISPHAQAGGFGRTLLDYAEAYARREWNSSVMEMTVLAQRAELVAWYERRGYIRTGETRDFPYGDPSVGIPRRDDLHFVVLTKKLTAAPVR
jgi:ribosomal protein S18 acetylase RimI-like enzyme